MICDINMHDKKDNPHFHTMITMRDIDSDAEFGFGNKNRTWNRKNLVDVWRHDFTDCINKHLEQAGSPIRYSCETLEAQEIDRIAQIHTGPEAIGMDERGEQSWRVKQNNKIIDFNTASSKLKAIKAAATEEAKNEDEAKLKKQAEMSLTTEQRQRRMLANYISLIDKLDGQFIARNKWLETKPVKPIFDTVEGSQYRRDISLWKKAGDYIRATILKTIKSIKSVTADYFEMFACDIKSDEEHLLTIEQEDFGDFDQPDDIDINGP